MFFDINKSRLLNGDTVHTIHCQNHWSFRAGKGLLVGLCLTVSSFPFQWPVVTCRPWESVWQLCRVDVPQSTDPSQTPGIVIASVMSIIFFVITESVRLTPNLSPSNSSSLLTHLLAFAANPFIFQDTALLDAFPLLVVFDPLSAWRSQRLPHLHRVTYKRARITLDTQWLLGKLVCTCN